MQKKRTAWNTRTSVVLWANRFQFAAGERVLNPRVLSRLLLWCQEGGGKVRINGRWYTMKPDDFLFLPWQHEVLYVADEREPFWVAAIHIIPDHPLERELTFTVSHRAKDAWAKCGWRRDLAWPGLEGVKSGVARRGAPMRLLGSYLLERFEEGDIPESTLRKMTQLLVEEIGRTVAERPTAMQGNDAVRRVQELVEAHGNRRFSLVELGRLVNCSVSTLRRQFQRSLGMPPYEWMLQARFQRARRLLSSTTLRVNEVAAQVGFDDAFQFSRMFKQRVGVSPRRYRAAHAFAPK